MKGLLEALAPKGKGDSPKKPAMDPGKKRAMAELRKAMQGDDDDALASALSNAMAMCGGEHDADD